jgi:hypothetical protein
MRHRTSKEAANKATAANKQGAMQYRVVARSPAAYIKPACPVLPVDFLIISLHNA